MTHGAEWAQGRVAATFASGFHLPREKNDEKNTDGRCRCPEDDAHVGMTRERYASLRSGASHILCISARFSRTIRRDLTTARRAAQATTVKHTGSDAIANEDEQRSGSDDEEAIRVSADCGVSPGGGCGRRGEGRAIAAVQWVVALLVTHRVDRARRTKDAQNLACSRRWDDRATMVCR